MSLQSSFELPLDVLRARSNEKWKRYPADVLPAFVAEMDFAVSHSIRRVIERLVDDQDFGYPHRAPGKTGSALAEAFAERMQNRFGWSLDAGLVDPLGDLVQGTFAAITAYSDPGDGVILHLPAYPPFHASIHQTGRRLIANQLRDSGTRFELDLDAMRASVDATTRIILLCSPQNPTGRVFSRDELAAIGAIAIEHDLIIVADEIHADLIYPGNVHVPIASISPEIAARTVTITSATKGFNIPGLRCGVMHFGSAALRERLRARIPERIMGQPGIVGVDATIAAWRHGQPWLDDVLLHLERMRDRAAQFVASELPGITMRVPEATYLAWLDCSRLVLNSTAFEFFLDRAKVGFSPGEAFDPARGDFVRLNFATSGAILDQILGRMAEAVRRR